MTLGEGIFWSTVLILTAAAVCQVSIRRWWKTVGKVFGVQVLIGGIIGAGVWGWFEYQDRPYVVEELAGLRLGMTPVEVQLAKGKPIGGSDEEPFEQDDEFRMGWILGGNEYDPWHAVIFFGDAPNEMELGIVCEHDGSTSLLGIKRSMSGDGVIKKLGQPSHESIHRDGLSKTISYEKWNVSYEIKKGQVIKMCISHSGKVVYADQYEDEYAERAE